MRSYLPFLLAVGLIPTPATKAPGPDTARATRLEVSATGNEARYKVREQLAGVDFPNDAIGVTSAITGQIVLDDKGAVVPDQSVITIDLRPLKSDKDRRDGYVQRRLLNTAEFPTTALRVTAFQGAPTPLPTSGNFTFTLTGDLTLRGVTRPTTWTVTATATPTGYTGSATTSFTFADFEMTKPRVAVVLSVEDTIALEYDFTLLKR